MIHEAFISMIEPHVSLDDVRVILDIGSRDAVQAVEFAARFPKAHVWAFEPNPQTIQRCVDNVRYMPNVTLVKSAVYDRDGVIDFYPIDPERTVTTWADGNPGASSIFLSNGAYDEIEKYAQTHIRVPCCRIDTFAEQMGIDRIDLVWIDVQGAEVGVLRSFSDRYMAGVRAIHTETWLTPIYHNQSTYVDMVKFMDQYKFRRVDNAPTQGIWFDTVWVKGKDDATSESVKDEPQPGEDGGADSSSD